jgi:hypothetical protein
VGAVCEVGVTGSESFGPARSAALTPRERVVWRLRTVRRAVGVTCGPFVDANRENMVYIENPQTGVAGKVLLEDAGYMIV